MVGNLKLLEKSTCGEFCKYVYCTANGRSNLSVYHIWRLEPPNPSDGEIVGGGGTIKPILIKLVFFNDWNWKLTSFHKENLMGNAAIQFIGHSCGEFEQF